MMDLSIEELSLSGWPALQTAVYDGWILRFAEGHTKRSNSVNPLYASTIGIDEKIEACERAYARRRLPTIFKITEAESQKPIDEALEERLYARIDETAVRTLDLAALSAEGACAAADRNMGEASRDCRDCVAISDRFEEPWIEAFCACSKSEARRGTIGRILANVDAGAIVASARRGGEIVGCGYGALDRGWVGLFDIVVAKDVRRQGYGEAIVAAILEAAAGAGARRAYLQVVVGNAAAERLYDKLGFEEKYRYWYRRRD
jgi:N-acetylglutamate synthase